MIGGWLVKVLIGIAVLGFAAVELGSPFVAAAQADDAAHEVANEVSFRLRDSFLEQTLDTSCADEAAKHDVEATCDYDPSSDEVHAHVTKHARSFLLDRFSATKDWYVVDADARAKRK